MPELPEVAALTDFLGQQLIGTVLTKIQIASFAVLKTADPPFSALEGRAVTGVRRFGKFVSVDADGLYFVFHLARAGWVRFTEAPNDIRLKMGRATLRRGCPFPAGPGPRGLDLTEAGTKKGLAVYVVRDPHDVPGIARSDPTRSARGSTSIPWRRSSVPVPSRSRASCGARASLPASETPTVTRSCTPPGFHRSPLPSPWTGRRSSCFMTPSTAFSGRP